VPNLLEYGRFEAKIVGQRRNFVPVSAKSGPLLDFW
jgi:hypothetical protein